MQNTKQKRYFFLFLLTTLSGVYISWTCLANHGIYSPSGQGVKNIGGENIVCIRLRDFPEKQEKRKPSVQISKKLKQEIRRHKKVQKLLLDTYNQSAREHILEQIIQNGKYLAILKEQYKLAKSKNISTI